MIRSDKDDYRSPRRAARVGAEHLVNADVRCPTCRGTGGTMADKSCPTCGGRRYVSLDDAKAVAQVRYP